jgi:hypothetical protein
MAAKVTASGEIAESLLDLIFNGTRWPNMAINDTTSPFTVLYVSLHTSSPGATGNQSTNEATYSSYQRVAVARSPSGWVVSGNSVSPLNLIQFPQATGGSETETYFGVGTASSGAGHLLYFGPISPTIAVATGVIPELTTGTAITET